MFIIALTVLPQKGIFFNKSHKLLLLKDKISADKCYQQLPSSYLKRIAIVCKEWLNAQTTYYNIAFGQTTTYYTEFVSEFFNGFIIFAQFPLHLLIFASVRGVYNEAKGAGILNVWVPKARP